MRSGEASLHNLLYAGARKRAARSKSKAAALKTAALRLNLKAKADPRNGGQSLHKAKAVTSQKCDATLRILHASIPMFDGMEPGDDTTLAVSFLVSLFGASSIQAC
ncbi:MAG TPA: hypothetical protein VFO34_16790 [Candidatus Acidoferrales bacterium]|nr:hypothetical protein [Candidatus Acidoferrales bacterium]